MNFDQTDVLLLPGNPDERYWFYSNQEMNLKEFDYPLDLLTVTSSPSQFNNATSAHDLIQNNSAFDSYMPTPSSSRTTPSPQMSLSRPLHTSSSSAKKEKLGSKKGRSAKTATVSEDETPENKSLRRREQNRIAQRTFRERKDRYIQTLETHIKELNARQHSLEANYKKSTDQVSVLYTQLAELKAELDYWRTGAHNPAPSETEAIPMRNTEAELTHNLQIHPFCSPR
ncbi:hypothetical protein BGW36DRAFT_155137 [Talaromyces proteolyticus]|uniref:BZIP domain-containing protein n=1 Tax=Talaromyces proteolyticus TaxID=1131652 RepID=A0AAD4KS21_9EURO|nr:uncharacterized protein BGW36DRAFT_155137 [Talaromyces proteolyticus]KAH8699109.1 hypothetical protein BGW36DRAFT_155137 [Talaromyces proteolyticus]